jgi:hypothetical protein
LQADPLSYAFNFSVSQVVPLNARRHNCELILNSHHPF